MNTRPLMARFHDVELRAKAARGDVVNRRVALTGAETEWSNDTSYPVGVAFEVVRGGALGAVLTVRDETVPADMPGARTRFFTLDPNARVLLTIPAGVRVAVLVAEPGPFERFER
jgi:hypothetical protein